MMPFATLKVALFVSLVMSAGAAFGETPGRYCARIGNDDSLRPIPRSLVPEAVRRFGLEHVPATQVLRSTVFRCMNGAVLACNYGANLPCGKADGSIHLPEAGAVWCQGHPDAGFIPAYITGHATIYRWRCAEGAPVAGGPVAKTDARGFLTKYWKRLDQAPSTRTPG